METIFCKNFSFIDAENKTVFIELRIENNRLSICGNTQGSGGQIADSIKPANKFQKRLIEIWRAYHLNDMHAGTEEQEAALGSEEFKKFVTRSKAEYAEAKKIQKIAAMSLEEYVTHIDAWKFIDSQNKTVRSYPIACKNDLDIIRKIFKMKTALPSTFSALTHKLYMGEQKSPFKDVNFSVLQDDLHTILAKGSDNYSLSCAYLKSIKLYISSNNGQPYTYGHAWLKRALPTGLMDELDTLVANIGEEFSGSSYDKQANDFLVKYGITFTAKFKKRAKYFHGDEDERDIYTCKFKRAEGWFSITFGQSIANAGTAPTAYDVLTCLTKTDPESFEDFCGNFGYDTDSRKAMKIYKSVCKEWLKVGAFFTEEELNELQDIN